MSEHRDNIRSQTSEVWKKAQYASVGLELGISITLGYWLGTKAQSLWDIAPWGVIIGVLLGFASGLRRLMKIAILESQRAPAIPVAAPVSPMSDQHTQDSISYNTASVLSPDISPTLTSATSDLESSDE